MRGVPPWMTSGSPGPPRTRSSTETGSHLFPFERHNLPLGYGTTNPHNPPLIRLCYAGRASGVRCDRGSASGGTAYGNLKGGDSRRAGMARDDAGSRVPSGLLMSRCECNRRNDRCGVRYFRPAGPASGTGGRLAVFRRRTSWFPIEPQPLPFLRGGTMDRRGCNPGRRPTGVR